MELNFLLLLLLLLFSTFYRPSLSQQAYLNNTCLFTATTPANISEGYLCAGHETLSCKSLVLFRSRPPSYSTASAIARLLGADSSETASLNSVPPDAEIGPGEPVLVPLSCACPVDYFQHFAAYVVRPSDTYYTIAGHTYQGLTTCEALMSQNPSYGPENIAVGVTEVIMRVRCACPSDNQMASGVRALLTYPFRSGDTVTTIGERFGASARDLLDANTLSEESVIFADSPLLVPLKAESCSVNPRMFFCDCPAGTRAVNRSSGGSDCVPVGGNRFPVKFVALLGLGIGLVVLCIFLSSYKLHRFMKERRARKRKEEFFKQNGGLLLRDRLSSNAAEEKAKLFAAEELQRATDNYNRSRFLGEGGFGAVYKGMLPVLEMPLKEDIIPDGTVVAVKKSKGIGENRTEQFINEVVVLSRIDHRNIVRLLGCCLETETPLLVYEFVPNGTLSQHIRPGPGEPSSLSWENRLSVACDVVGALAYMHSSASTPVFHSDVKSSNVLLDDKYNAKVSDFGTSRPVPGDKTHLTTAVQGTLGYMDPEYFQSSQFTDKSDVYSFGIVLVELLTGETPFSFAGDRGEKNLVSAFVSLTKEDRLIEILDPRVAGDADVDDLRVAAELAARCLRLNGKKRPTMKQVSVVLEGLRDRHTVLEMDQDTRSFGGFEEEETYLSIYIDGASVESNIIGSL